MFCQALWVLLDKNHSAPHATDKQLINYEDFLKVAAEAGPKCKCVLFNSLYSCITVCHCFKLIFKIIFRTYLTPSVFAKLQLKEPHGRISIMALFNYVMRKVWLHQTRIGLSLYDVTGQGYLRESVSTSQTLLKQVIK